MQQSTQLTWIDVSRRLSTLDPTDELWQHRPTGLIRAQVDWDGVSFDVLNPKETTEKLIDWLSQVFPHRLVHDEDTLGLLMDGPDQAKFLPIYIEERTGEITPARPNTGAIESTIDFGPPSNAARLSSPPVIICHSIKGGTGRTTAAIATALRWAELAGGPVLLVDADVEAPGLSYLFRRVRSETRISLEDAIVLCHAATDESRANVIKYIADRLVDHQLDGDVIVLPLRRDLDELASSSIRAEHLSTPSRPFALTDMLREIAIACGAHGVVVDVRAGLVPLAAQLALDPTVAGLYSTSMSGQSLDATAALLKFVSRETRRRGHTPVAPLLLVNRIPSVFRETGADEALLRPTLDSLTIELLRGRTSEASADEALFNTEDEITPLWVCRVPEISDLQATPSHWEKFVEQIRNSGFTKRLSASLDEWLRVNALEAAPAASVKPVAARQVRAFGDGRKKLQEFARKLVAAETADSPVETPLITRPLAELARQFRTQLPIVVIEGAKGTGKTLTGRFLTNRRTWSAAVTAVSGQPPQIDGQIVPVWASIQSSSTFQSEVDARREEASQQLGLPTFQRIDRTRVDLLQRLNESKTEDECVSAWLDAIAWSVGLREGKRGAGEELISYLRRNRRHLLAIIEGVEELYANPFADGVPEKLRSLLVDLPQRLRGEPGRPIGLIVFARRDTVEAAVPQNRDQFRRTYEDFALRWSDEDVLELAAWLSTKSGALSLWDEKFRSLPQSEREKRLESLWGRKLGPDDKPERRTAEAYTANWITAVLSDLQSRLVARDLIRLLENAAAYEPGPADTEFTKSRLLVPKSLKAAVKPTSEAKVAETEEEISELARVFDKFRKNPDKVVAPIDADAVAQLGLVDADIEMLRRHGILFGDAPPFEVPELFRMGLNLRHSGARHSVINLRRKARQRLGLS